MIIGLSLFCAFFVLSALTLQVLTGLASHVCYKFGHAHKGPPLLAVGYLSVRQVKFIKYVAASNYFHSDDTIEAMTLLMYCNNKE